MRLQAFAMVCFAWVAMACLPVGAAQNGTPGGPHGFPNAPQDFVVCTGWHALCTNSHDCQMQGKTADCDCMRVNEPHIIATSEIQDEAVKRQTEVKCTYAHPCGMDEAPICKVIQNGQYEVQGVPYQWVSTYSYRGWCTLMQTKWVACNPGPKDYVGDLHWAICDLAPCTEISNPANAEKPLSCQCRVQDSAFIGVNGTCTGENGGIMSSSPVDAWDFQKNTYAFPMPGYEYVQGSCAPLISDPLPQAKAGAVLLH